MQKKLQSKPEVDAKQNEKKLDVKYELNKNKPTEISMVKKEDNENVIKNQSKVKIKILQTGESSNLSYIGGILNSFVAFLKLSMKKFRKR